MYSRSRNGKCDSTNRRNHWLGYDQFQDGERKWRSGMRETKKTEPFGRRWPKLSRRLSSVRVIGRAMVVINILGMTCVRMSILMVDIVGDVMQRSFRPIDHSLVNAASAL